MFVLWRAFMKIWNLPNFYFLDVIHFRCCWCMSANAPIFRIPFVDFLREFLHALTPHRQSNPSYCFENSFTTETSSMMSLVHVYMMKGEATPHTISNFSNFLFICWNLRYSPIFHSVCGRYLTKHELHFLKMHIFMEMRLIHLEIFLC